MIGDLRHRVTLQQVVDVADAGGGSTQSWQDVVTLWAEILPLSGGEDVRAMAVSSTQKYRLRLRYRADITPAQRFVRDAQILNIRAVRDRDGRGRWIECLCEAGVAD
ncbi:MAG TPA: head-tail adaptor protein [Alphaproteobacteria bacterium]|nr:head-tail adaptor protein [Alphaproteobacteria bacterium]HBF98932.1 head-tail adaptor protein [Alphaproteobacteria bacterium]